MTKKQRKRKKKLRMMNKRLVKKWYFLAPRNVWTGQIPKDYNYTWIDWWGFDTGWGKAFGWMFLKELGDAVKESGRKDFQILDQKEKFGELRTYTGYCSEKVQKIIDKYECISRHVCYYCGIEAPITDDGYILPRCFECYCKECRRSEAWAMKYNPDIKPVTDEELREHYEKIICSTPDENGEYHIPMSYTIRRYSKDGEEDIIYDISDTTKKIQKRINNYAKIRQGSD